MDILNETQPSRFQKFRKSLGNLLTFPLPGHSFDCFLAPLSLGIIIRAAANAIFCYLREIQCNKKFGFFATQAKISEMNHRLSMAEFCDFLKIVGTLVPYFMENKRPRMRGRRRCESSKLRRKTGRGCFEGLNRMRGHRYVFLLFA